MSRVSWYKTAHTMALLISVLILTNIVSATAYAHEEFVILRPKFDMVITEVEGENYVVIDRDPMSYLDERPINWTYRGPLEGEIAEIVDRRCFMLDELISIFENKCLPVLEETVGLKYWASYPAPDEDPPALYIGLYRPTEGQMRAVVDMLEVEAEKVARKWGTEKAVIKFYEAFAYRGLEHALEEAGDRFCAAVEKGVLNSSVFAFCLYLTDAGWFEVIFVYGDIANSVDRELAVYAVKAVRDVIGYEVTLVIAFFKEWRLEPEPLVEPEPGAGGTLGNVLYTIAMVAVPFVAIITTTAIASKWKHKVLQVRPRRLRRR